MELRLEHLVKDFSGTKAVNDVSITIQDGKLTGLLGPSGCGKSCLLYTSRVRHTGVAVAVKRAPRKEENGLNQQDQRGGYGDVEQNVVQGRDCLLYTSRCV